MLLRSLGIAGLAFATTLAPAWAIPPAHCSQETLPVRGTPVTVEYCLTAPPRGDATGDVVVPVVETYRAPSGAFSRARELHFLGGENVSRVLEKVQLSRLGMAGVLHLTLAYSAGSVWVEGAMLTPGAITIK